MCFIFIFTGRVQTPPTEAGPVYLQNMILESVLRPRAHLISVFCFWIERLHKGTVYHFRNNRTYFDDRLSQMWVHTPIVYSQNACFAQNITLAPRSTSRRQNVAARGSCRRRRPRTTPMPSLRSYLSANASADFFQPATQCRFHKPDSFKTQLILRLKIWFFGRRINSSAEADSSFAVR